MVVALPRESINGYKGWRNSATVVAVTLLVAGCAAALLMMPFFLHYS
jgi:hypothetical protein